MASLKSSLMQKKPFRGLVSLNVPSLNTNSQKNNQVHGICSISFSSNEGFIYHILTVVNDKNTHLRHIWKDEPFQNLIAIQIRGYILFSFGTNLTFKQILKIFYYRKKKKRPYKMLTNGLSLSKIQLLF